MSLPSAAWYKCNCQHTLILSSTITPKLAWLHTVQCMTVMCRGTLETFHYCEGWAINIFSKWGIRIWPWIWTFCIWTCASQRFFVGWATLVYANRHSSHCPYQELYSPIMELMVTTPASDGLFCSSSAGALICACIWDVKWPRGFMFRQIGFLTRNQNSGLVCRSRLLKPVVQLLMRYMDNNKIFHARSCPQSFVVGVRCCMIDARHCNCVSEWHDSECEV